MRGVIVIHNALNDSSKSECICTTTKRKSDIQQGLPSKNLLWIAAIKKKYLIGVVDTEKDRFTMYRMDAIAEDVGHTVLKLLPYHYGLNPRDVVRVQVKQEVRVQTSCCGVLHCP